jgi:hypothetical protein
VNASKRRRSPGLRIVVRAQSLRPTVLSWLARACTLRDATGRILQEVLGSGPRHGVFYKGGSHGEYTMLLLYCLTHPWNKAGPGAKPAHASPLWLLGRVFEAWFILMVAQEPPPREVTVLRMELWSCPIGPVPRQTRPSTLFHGNGAIPVASTSV